MGRKPKSKCCSSKPKCGRCPIRMMCEGTLPSGYTVKRRRLVKLGKGEKAAKFDKSMVKLDDKRKQKLAKRDKKKLKKAA